MARRSGIRRAAGLWLGPHDQRDVHGILRQARAKHATDVHIKAGSPIYMRVDGELQPVNEEPLARSVARHLSYALLSQSQIAKFEETLDLDFMTSDDDQQRYRVNVSFNIGAIGAVIRVLPNIPMLNRNFLILNRNFNRPSQSRAG